MPPLLYPKILEIFPSIGDIDSSHMNHSKMVKDSRKWSYFFRFCHSLKVTITAAVFHHFHPMRLSDPSDRARDI